MYGKTSCDILAILVPKARVSMRGGVQDHAENMNQRELTRRMFV